MILYDEAAGRKMEREVGSNIAGLRFTEITLTQQDFVKLLRNPRYMDVLVRGFRPHKDENNGGIVS